jgi:hypothetical protein
MKPVCTSNGIPGQNGVGVMGESECSRMNGAASSFIATTTTTLFTPPSVAPLAPPTRLTSLLSIMAQSHSAAVCAVAKSSQPPRSPKSVDVAAACVRVVRNPSICRIALSSAIQWHTNERDTDVNTSELLYGTSRCLCVRAAYVVALVSVSNVQAATRASDVNAHAWPATAAFGHAATRWSMQNPASGSRASHDRSDCWPSLSAHPMQ